MMRVLMCPAHIGVRSMLALTLALTGCTGTTTDAPAVTPAMTAAERVVIAGREVNVTYRFVVAPDAPRFEEDLLVFVHAINGDGKQVWTADHEPATPTRQWRGGATIEYTRPMVVPRRSPSGDLELDLGVYSPSTGKRLAMSGDDRGNRSYRAGSLDVRTPTDDSPAIYVDGWYDAEESPEAVWRWSSRQAEMWFRNPRRDSILVLEMDGTVPGLDGPRRVEVRTVSDVIEGFDLPPGLEVRRVPIPASQLGDHDIARIRIAVERTSVPADVREARSGDTRELGVRVFEAYLEPRKP